MKRAELESLIDALLDGGLSEADFLRLEAELHVNRAARDLYYNRVKLDQTLAANARDHAPRDGGDTPTPASKRRARPVLAVLLATAILAAGALIGWIAHPGNGEPAVGAKSPEPAAAGYAVLSDAAGTTWDAGPDLSRGDLVPDAPLGLASGVARIDLFSGVSLFVDAPARFRILSTMEVQVDAGSLRAEVPEHAAGFQLRTAGGTLRTEAADLTLNATADHTDLVLESGAANWLAGENPPATIGQRTPVRLTASGVSATDTGATTADLAQRLEAHGDARLAAWEEHQKGLVDAPDLLVYFPFAAPPAGGRAAADQSPGANDATVVAAAYTNDRWGRPGQALDFSPTGSRARLAVPGEHGSLTLTCWAKINSLDRWYNSLFLTDGHEIGEPHWQIMDDGRLFFSVKKQKWLSEEQPDKHIFFSPPFWDESMSGRWLHIATVYDVDNRTVSHYIDGQRISHEPVPDGYLVEQVSIGAASVGNWSEPKWDNPRFAIRNLNGAIDDFAIFGAALDAGQIAALYDISRP